MRPVVLAAILIALPATASADERAASSTDPTQQALVQMIGEAQTREAQALVQVYALRAQVADLKTRLDAQTKRAEDAEARLTAAPMAGK